MCSWSCDIKCLARPPTNDARQRGSVRQWSSSASDVQPILWHHSSSNYFWMIAGIEAVCGIGVKQPNQAAYPSTSQLLPGLLMLSHLTKPLPRASLSRAFPNDSNTCMQYFLRCLLNSMSNTSTCSKLMPCYKQLQPLTGFRAMYHNS